MNYSIPVDQDHPAFGYIYEIDILQDLLDIGWNEDYWTNSDLQVKVDPTLPFKNTRTVMDLDNTSDSVVSSLYSSILTYDNIVKMVSSNEETYKKFLALYPFRQNHDIKSFCQQFFTIHASVVFDQNTYSMGRHVDNRLIVGNFIVNLRDNDNSTRFYNGVNASESYYSAPTKKGKGVFFLNTEETTHSIDIQSSRERNIMMVALTIRT